MLLWMLQLQYVMWPLGHGDDVVIVNERVQGEAVAVPNVGVERRDEIAT